MRNTVIRNRHSIRLKNFDYQQPGIFYITLTTKDRERLFGNIVDSHMQFSPYGKIAQQIWLSLPKKFPSVSNEGFIIMPDHMHCLIKFIQPVPGGLSEVIRYFKTFSARRINRLRNSLRNPVWQRNYYEHIVRTDEELEKIRQYIQENPSRWQNSIFD